MDRRAILLVEDNPDDADLTLRAIKKNKITNEVIVAQNGIQAVEYLQPGTGEANPTALVLLDLKLPGMDGIEVLRRIRADERTSFLPVVILTTSGEKEDLIRSYRNGCNSYIRKPVDFVEFVATIQQIGAYWLGLNESPPM